MNSRGFGSVFSVFAAMLFALFFSGCAAFGPIADEMNPYGEGNSVQTLGNRDASAISDGGGASKEATRARHALEVMGTRLRANDPKPAYPVMQPAVVRLMWVPDHLDRHGNLVPANYYYLKVLHDIWHLDDAFDMEGQINSAGYGSAGGGAPRSYGTGTAGSSTPWVYKSEQ